MDERLTGVCTVMARDIIEQVTGKRPGTGDADVAKVAQYIFRSATNGALRNEWSKWASPSTNGGE